MAIAFFITFSTYGTWLPGTDKGSVDDQHNRYGSPGVVPDTRRENMARDLLSQLPYELDAARRTVVHDAIIDLSSERGWELWALHVRSNHIHLVISADRDPGRLMADLKARASRELNKQGFDSADRIRWTRHGSTLHLFDAEKVQEKIHYTLYEQGEAMAWFDGRKKGRTK